MRTHSSHKIWFAALLLLIFTAGCGDPDKNGVAASSPATPPTVVLVTPLNGNVGVCPNTAIISATFSKDMNPATINSATFTLAGPGGSVAGAVTYVVGTRVATFTPSSALALKTTYSVNVNTGVAVKFCYKMEDCLLWCF